MAQTNPPEIEALIALSGLLTPPSEVIRQKQSESQPPWYKRWIYRLSAKKTISASEDTSEILRDFYSRGLIRAEECLVGPASDWHKAITDVNARRNKLLQKLVDLDLQISAAKDKGADHKHFILTSAKDRIKSHERGHQEAQQRISHLIESTKDLIDGLYVGIDALYRSNEHDERLRVQEHDQIIDHLKRVGVTVSRYKLQVDQGRENIDLPNYLEEIELAIADIKKLRAH